jgi:hypothetical protein
MGLVCPKDFFEFKSGWYRNIDFNSEANILLEVIDASKKESDIQRYIKEKEKWFIPASLFKDYDFGHHEAYIAPEQALGSDYRVDYMLLGRNSIGYHIVLVEFEDVNVDYKIKSANMETEAVRKGLTQIKNWKRWVDSNKDYFMKSCELSDISNNVPTWGIRYCLVVSRRNRMGEVGNQLRRQSEAEVQGVHIVTYDRLVDNVKMLYNGF